MMPNLFFLYVELLIKIKKSVYCLSFRLSSVDNFSSLFFFFYGKPFRKADHRVLLGIRKVNFECFLIPEYVTFYLYSRNTSLVFTIEKLEKQVQAHFSKKKKKINRGGHFGPFSQIFTKQKLWQYNVFFFKHKYI